MILFPIQVYITELSSNHSNYSFTETIFVCFLVLAVTTDFFNDHLSMYIRSPWLTPTGDNFTPLYESRRPTNKRTWPWTRGCALNEVRNIENCELRVRTIVRNVEIGLNTVRSSYPNVASSSACHPSSGRPL